MIVSAVGYFFFYNRGLYHRRDIYDVADRRVQSLTFEKVRHYPHPRPAIEETITPTNPEPHQVGVALGTNEATPAQDLLGQDESTKDSRPAFFAKTNAENRQPERKIKPERLAHLHQSKVLARQRENHGYGMVLGYAEGYQPGLDAQR